MFYHCKLFTLVYVLSLYFVYSCSCFIILHCLLLCHFVIFLFAFHKSTPSKFENQEGQRPILSSVFNHHKIYSGKFWQIRMGKGQFCRRSDNHHKIYSVKFWKSGRAKANFMKNTITDVCCIIMYSRTISGWMDGRILLRKLRGTLGSDF